jgi:hypothetical protein
MKKPAAPLIPQKPAGANGLKPPAAKPETITINLDNVELGCMKAVQKGFEAMRAVINAQGQRIQELEAELAKANGSTK